MMVVTAQTTFYSILFLAVLFVFIGLLMLSYVPPHIIERYSWAKNMRNWFSRTDYLWHSSPPCSGAISTCRVEEPFHASSSSSRMLARDEEDEGCFPLSEVNLVRKRNRSGVPECRFDRNCPPSFQPYYPEEIQVVSNKYCLGMS